jgi:hypothetical protein
MAIETIPKITASNSGGGIVYSIDFQRSFASEPSRVTYKVVNSSGTYSSPSIESDASISFSGFNFNGYIYSYELEESNSGNILSITLIDKSVILDKLYVCVFRRGLLGHNGSKQSKTVPVKFDKDDEYYYIEKDASGFFKVKKKNFTNGSVTRDIYGGSTKKGDIIIVGEEEIPETNCEIPASSYTFDQLKAAVGGSVSGFGSCPINDNKVKQTYEGTLRSVLNSWCQDFGYSFYWDYSANSLKFFDAKNGVFSIPSSVSDAKIVSKRTSRSAEGKYNQVAVDYFAKPYNPKTGTASLSKTYYSTSSLNSYNMSYFLDRSLKESDGSLYGGKRSSNEFIVSAALGYVSPALRKIYNYSWIADWGGHAGISNSKALAVSKAAVALKNAGFSDVVKDMLSYSGYAQADLDGAYYALLAKYDEGTEEAWTNLEQEIFTSKIGNFYRCPYNKSGQSVFCSPRMIVKTSIDFEPEGDIMEDNDAMEDDKLVGRRVFSRGAPGPDKSAALALKELGLTDGNIDLQKLLPIQIEILKGSKLYSELKAQTVNPDGYDTLLIFPQPGLVSTKTGFTASYRTGTNDKEVTYKDIEDSQGDNEEECTLEDPNEGKCLSQKEELKQKQRKEQEAKSKFETKKPFSGLVNKSGSKGANIKTKSGDIKILSSADAQYRSVTTYSYSVEAIVDDSEEQKIISNTAGSTSSSSKIIETRLIVENRTTAENLSKETPTPQDLSTREGYSQSQDLEKVSYSCAGFVSGLPTSVTSGLETLDMSISDAGFTATYSYSTRPPVFGKQDLSRTNIGSSSSAPAFQLR